MRKLIGIAVILGFSLMVPASGGAQGALTLDQIYANLDKVNKSFKTVEANIERTMVTIIVPDDKEIKSGKFYYARVGKEPRVLVETTKPSLETILIDKGLLQIYNPGLKQVQQASVAQHKDMVEQIMATGFGQSSAEMKNAYEVTLAGEEVIDGQKTTVLDLKPRKPSSVIKSMRLWLESSGQQRWIAVQNKFTQPSGDYDIFKFTNIKLNGGIPDSRFKLDLPKGVTIIKL